MKLLCPLWGEGAHNKTHTHTHSPTPCTPTSPHTTTLHPITPWSTTHTASAPSRHHALYRGFSSGRENTRMCPSVSITIRVGWSAATAPHSEYTPSPPSTQSTDTAYSQPHMCRTLTACSDVVGGDHVVAIILIQLQLYLVLLLCRVEGQHTNLLLGAHHQVLAVREVVPMVVQLAVGTR